MNYCLKAPWNYTLLSRIPLRWCATENNAIPGEKFRCYSSQGFASALLLIFLF
jgi:hypothetical protein